MATGLDRSLFIDASHSDNKTLCGSWQKATMSAVVRVEHAAIPVEALTIFWPQTLWLGLLLVSLPWPPLKKLGGTPNRASSQARIKGHLCQRHAGQTQIVHSDVVLYTLAGCCQSVKRLENACWRRLGVVEPHRLMRPRAILA